MNGQLLHPPNHDRPDKLESPLASSFGDSGIVLEDRTTITRPLSQVRIRYLPSDGPETPRLESHDCAPLLDRQDLPATEARVWLRDEHGNDISRVGAIRKNTLDRESEMDPAKVPLPSPDASELRMQKRYENRLAIWRRFLELHHESVVHRVSAQEQRRHAEMLRSSFTRNLQTLNLLQRLNDLRTGSQPASSIQEALNNLVELQTTISEADAALNATETQLVSLEWEIAELSPGVSGDDGQGEATYRALLENDVDLHGEKTYSESSMQIVTDYDPDLEAPQLEISRKLNLIDTLEDLSVDIREQQAEAALRHDAVAAVEDSPRSGGLDDSPGGGRRTRSTTTATSADNEFNRRQDAVQREIDIARHELDQLRAPEFASFAPFTVFTPSESPFATEDTDFDPFILTGGDFGGDKDPT